MSATPLLRTPQISGGTFYAFASASRDLTKAFNNENLKFVFDKFVCLDIPDIKKLDLGTFSNKNNFVQFDAIDGAIFSGINADHNINLAESLQNYALNFETGLLNDDDFDPNLKRTVSERVFFKWLKELGGIRFRNALNTEVSDAVTESRFVEENTIESGTEQYSRVIKYLGNIDIINHVQSGGETFTELYLNIPTEAGNTPTVLFNSISDDNYHADQIVTGTSEFIFGRSISTVHPENLKISAFYDYDSSVDYTDPDAAWHGQPPTGGLVNSYFTEPGTLDDPSNLDIQKFPVDFGSPSGFSGTAYIRSKLDGISIDFNPENYFDIATDASISNMQQYNSADKASNFEFNTVLVYYDLFDTSDILDRATNLYGVLFLDNITPTVEGGFIDRFQKVRPNTVTKLNGNSFGLKINIKFDASVTTVGVDTIVNDYNTFSMGLFIDASTQLQLAAAKFEQQQNKLDSLVGRIEDLEDRIFTIDSIQTLQIRMDELENSVANAQIAFSDSTSILDLIAANADEIQNIVNGETSLQLQYNTDVISAGSGITVDKSIVNKVKIVNKVQEYSLTIPVDDAGNEINSSNKLDLNTTLAEVFVSLEEFTNILRLETENAALGNIRINIDDTVFKFQKGQVIRLIFPEEIDLAGNDIEFFSDAKNRFGSGELEFLIASIDNSDLLSDRPIIEIICIDERNYTFTFDVLR